MKMPFSIGKKSILKKIKYISEKFVFKNIALVYSSSRKRTDLIIPQTSQTHFFLNMKRVVSFAFPTNAFITIEAAVVLVITLMAMLSVLSFGIIMNQKMQLEAPIRNACSKIAQDYYLYDSLTDFDESILSEYTVRGVGIVAARQMVIEEVGKERLDESCIVGGADGLSFTLSDICDDEGYVDLIVTYKLRFPFQLIPLSDVNVCQRCRIHSWTGEEVVSKTDVEDEYVYMTETGSVYHTSLSCRHISIYITTVSLDEIKEKRNSSGGKYYACEICWANHHTSMVMITKTGTSYHSLDGCPSLLRKVKRVKKSEIIGVPKCKNCGE